MLALGLLLGGRMQKAGPVVEVVRFHDTLRTVALEGSVEEMIRYIDARYVDQIGRDSLLQGAIESLMRRLDPHSEYLPPAEVLRLKESREGRFTGIGIEYTVMDDTVYVLRPIPGGPGQEAGLLPGDRLLTVDETPVSGQGLESLRIADLMRGEQGSRVRLKIWRPTAGLLDVSLQRANVEVPSVLPGAMLDENTGYISIRRFGTHTYREFMQELERLIHDEGMQHLVLDLRGNPGGYLHEAVNILSQLFAERNRLLVYTVGRQQDRREYHSTGRTFFDVGRLIVLVDEGSASASEIVAGAIQDWDRGLIAGRRTFGKGLVQEQYTLSHGGALLLTIARYFTPSGRSIQRDYSDPTRYKEEIKERFRHGDHSPSGPSAVDTNTYFTYHGRNVFGGGGITPDITLTADTVRASAVYQEWANRINRFILQELLANTDVLESDLLGQPDFLWDSFLAWALRTYGKKLPGLGRNAMTEALRMHLLLEMARINGGPEEQNRIQILYDPEIQAAVRLMSDKKAFAALQRQ